MKQLLRDGRGLFLIFILFLAGCQSQNTIDPVLTAKGIRKISVLDSGKEIYSISYEPGKMEETYEYWKMKVPYEDKVIVDTEAMLKLYESLEFLDFTPVEADYENTGLSGACKEIALEFCQAVEGGEAPSNPAADKKCVLMIGDLDGAGNYYTALKSNPQRVYQMDQSIIDSIVNVDTFTLILKVGALVPINTVKEVNISIESNEYRLSCDGKKYNLNGQDTDTQVYKSLYTELLSILLEKELPEDSKGHKASPELHMEFVRNWENLSNVSVDYFSYDNTYAVLSIDGVENFLVRQRDVDRLIKTIKGYF